MRSTPKRKKDERGLMQTGFDAMVGVGKDLGGKLSRIARKKR